jgi:hypothetical protein
MGIAAIVVVAVINILFVAVCILLLWIARGEGDVNGDPERDAGLLEPHAPPAKPEIRRPKSEGRNKSGCLEVRERENAGCGVQASARS